MRLRETEPEKEREIRVGERERKGEREGGTQVQARLLPIASGYSTH